MSSPLLLDNEVAKDTFQLEYFYLLYDPPTSDCGTGSSWLVRMATDGSTQKMLSVQEYQGIRATGMSSVGGGQDLAIAHVDLTTRTTAAFTVTGNPLSSGLRDTIPLVEVWREVGGRSN